MCWCEAATCRFSSILLDRLVRPKSILSAGLQAWRAPAKIFLSAQRVKWGCLAHHLSLSRFHPVAKMASNPPHALAPFTLYPLNERAATITALSENARLISVHPSTGRPGIDVGISFRSTSRQTLATLGRHGTDIHIMGSYISRLQCSFEIHERSNTIMLYDRSHSNTTQVFSDDQEMTDVYPFVYGRHPRRVLVAPNVNTVIGMGGSRCDLVQFKLVWWDRDPKILQMPQLVVPDSKLARTYDVDETEVPSRRETRIHSGAAAGSPSPIRYKKEGDHIGKGRFGTVYRAINVDSGDCIAVKIVSRGEQLDALWGSTLRATLKNEVQRLSDLDHASSPTRLHSLNILTDF